MTERRAGTRLSLSALQTVYLGPGRTGPLDEDGDWSVDRTISLVKGIRVAAIQEPTDILNYLNDLKKRFILRGRIKRQIRYLLRNSKPLLGRGVVYASHPNATHRVLVYAYHGRLLREYSAETPNGDVIPLPAYEASSYVMEPLARVDVRPPMAFLSRKHKVLEEYREAVERSAESLALRWYQRFAGSMGGNWRGMAVTGIAADLICLLKPRDRIRQRVWTNEKPKNIGTAANGSDKHRTNLSRFFADLSKRR